MALTIMCRPALPSKFRSADPSETVRNLAGAIEQYASFSSQEKKRNVDARVEFRQDSQLVRRGQNLSKNSISEVLSSAAPLKSASASKVAAVGV